MDIARYLNDHQPMLARQFANAFRSGHLSHSYLISGEAGSPLLEIAMYLAKTLVCAEPRPLADNKCWNCLRIDDGNYADIQVFDGQRGTIKKEAIQALESNFERTPVEPASKLIYIVHLVENVTPEAVNALLKFLEEPHQEVYAFLTTENEVRVLPTIISRTQKLRVLPINRQPVIEAALSRGISEQDAELLSFFHHDAAAMEAALSENAYHDVIVACNDFFKLLAHGRRQAHLAFHLTLVERFAQKEQWRFILDVFALFVADLLALQNGGVPKLASYDKILRPLASRFRHLEGALLEILLCRSQIDLNVNGALLLDHACQQLLREYRHDDD